MTTFLYALFVFFLVLLLIPFVQWAFVWIRDKEHRYDKAARFTFLAAATLAFLALALWSEGERYPAQYLILASALFGLLSIVIRILSNNKK